MTDMQRRIARARLLRRDGKTYDEIRAVIGPVSDDSLKAWLVGIPRPPQTRLSHPLTELRRECRRLRLQGLSYSEIAAATGASAGSLNLWLRDLHQAPGVLAAARNRKARGPAKAGRRTASAALQRREDRIKAAFGELAAISQRELLIAGVALYWAEGTKAKPWRPNDRQVRFINSDVDVMRAFLTWLDAVGVPARDRTYCLSIHETADARAEERWWVQQLQIPEDQFLAPWLKKHNPATVRHNVGDGYHGCLVVRVRRSVWLYDRIEGLWRGFVASLVAGAAALDGHENGGAA
jgi:hypothetical protein